MIDLRLSKDEVRFIVAIEKRKWLIEELCPSPTPRQQNEMKKCDSSVLSDERLENDVEND